MYELIDSLKSYAIAVFSFLVSAVQTVSEVIQFITVVLTLLLVIVKLISDVPKSVEIFRAYREKGKP